MQAKEGTNIPVQSPQTNAETSLTRTNNPAISVSGKAWQEFENAFPLGLPTVVGFVVLWVLFGEFAWGDRTKWPSGLTDLPQVDVPLQLAFAVVVVAMLVYVRLLRRAPLATLGLNLREIGPDVRWLLRALPVLALGYLALGGLAVLGVYIVADHPLETIKNTLRASFFQDTGVANLFRVLIAAPVLEEIWYRGMLYTPLRRERGRWVAIIFTTLYFGFSHGPFPVTQLLGGLIFAWAYECRRTLVAPMVLHFCGNGTLVLGGILVHKWNLLG